MEEISMSIRYHHSSIMLIAIALALPSGVGFAQTETGRKTAPQAATYEVDVSASRVYVKVGIATRLGHEHGVEGNLKSGKLTPGGEGELIFDMTSFMADTAEARKRVGLDKKKVSENEAKKVTEAM